MLITDVNNAFQQYSFTYIVILSFSHTFMDLLLIPGDTRATP